MAINVLKQTSTESVIQVIDANGTIALSSLLSVNQVVAGTPTVNIKKVIYSATGTSNITVARNAVNLLTCAYSNTMDFAGFGLTLQNTSDIVCTVPTGCNIILVLHKIAGYTDSVTNAGINPENLGPR